MPFAKMARDLAVFTLDGNDEDGAVRLFFGYFQNLADLLLDVADFFHGLAGEVYDDGITFVERVTNLQFPVLAWKKILTVHPRVEPESFELCMKFADRDSVFGRVAEKDAKFARRRGGSRHTGTAIGELITFGGSIGAGTIHRVESVSAWGTIAPHERSTS